MKTKYILILLSVLCFQLNAQTPERSIQIECDSLKYAGDCNNALEIRPINQIEFMCTSEGHGDKLEIKGYPSKSLYFFEKEHNTIWLKFDIPIDALFTFKLIPKDTTYDYDFLLFKQEDTSLCEKILERDLRPVRSSISRNDLTEKSITGLSVTGNQPYVHSGPGDIFSSGIEVAKGERYYLVIDNVYGGQAGFYLQFGYYETKTITGRVFDEETGLPLKSTISLENAATGEVLVESESEPDSGRYEIILPVFGLVTTPNPSYIQLSMARNTI